MHPKKTFTMSFILKHAISKKKQNEVHLSFKKIHINNANSPPSCQSSIIRKNGKKMNNQKKINDFDIVFGDVFIFGKLSSEIPLFEILNKIKKIDSCLWNPSLRTYEFFLNELPFSFIKDYQVVNNFFYS